MRPVKLLCSALVVLAPAFASAQTPPPDSVTEVLRQKARPGTVQEYEAVARNTWTGTRRRTTRGSGRCSRS